jgi:hypothetical protein
MADRTSQLTGPAIMVLSALIFGYFGWVMKPIIDDGKIVLFTALLCYTLRISAGLFVLSAVITLALPMLGNLLYALVGVVGAGLFVVVVVMDVADKNYQTVHPAILLLFAVWNGYGSWLALRAILARRAEASAGPAPPPE